MTLMQALAQAGGLTPRGTERGIRVHRKDATGAVTDPRAEDERPGRARRRHLRQRIALLRCRRGPRLNTFGSSGRASGSCSALFVLIAAAGIAIDAAAAAASTPPRPRWSSRCASIRRSARWRPALAAPSYMATQVEILRSERVAVARGQDPRRRALRRRRSRSGARRPRPRSRSSATSPACCSAACRSSRRAAATSSTSPSRPPIRSSRRPPPTRSRRPTWTSRSSCASRRRASRRPSSTSRRRRCAPTSRAAQAQAVEVPADEGHRRHRRAPRPGERALQHADRAAGDGAGRAGRDRRRGSATPAARRRPTSCSSAAVQGLKSQLAIAETKLTEISSIVGKNHPSAPCSSRRRSASCKQQIAAEIAARLRRHVDAEPRQLRRRSPSCRRWSTSRRSSCWRCAPTATRSPSTSATSTPRSAPTTPSAQRARRSSTWKARTTRPTRAC